MQDPFTCTLYKFVPTPFLSELDGQNITFSCSAAVTEKYRHLSLADPHLLKLHFHLGRVIRAKAMAKHVDDYQREMEELEEELELSCHTLGEKVQTWTAGDRVFQRISRRINHCCRL
jgi:hypothetical protein